MDPVVGYGMNEFVTWLGRIQDWRDRIVTARRVGGGGWRRTCGVHVLGWLVLYVDSRVPPERCKPLEESLKIVPGLAERLSLAWRVREWDVTWEVLPKERLQAVVSLFCGRCRT